MSRHTLRRPRAAAFTLIELLVVIAIIAILAAILFPVFAQARESARKIGCLSNTKELGTAILMYAQDYDEQIVPYKMFKSSTPIQGQLLTVWVNTLQPYIKNGGATNSGQYDGVTPPREPQGMMACPSKPEANFVKAADSAECDGDGTPNSNGFIPPLNGYYIAHYAVAFGGNCSNTAACSANFGIARDGSPGAPFFHYPGAYFDASISGAPFVPQALPSVVEPARTGIAADGPTVVRELNGNLRITSGFGC
jgi:prepilin-type N-terminal cleavage/methylation domain-containing protein